MGWKSKRYPPFWYLVLVKELLQTDFRPQALLILIFTTSCILHAVLVHFCSNSVLSTSQSYYELNWWHITNRFPNATWIPHVSCQRWRLEPNPARAQFASTDFALSYAERMDVHCLESGCIGKYIPLGPRDFPRAGILHLVYKERCGQEKLLYLSDQLMYN